MSLYRRTPPSDVAIIRALRELLDDRDALAVESGFSAPLIRETIAALDAVLRKYEIFEDPSEPQA